MAVPFLDLVAQYRTIQSAVEAAVAGVLASQRFILGPEVEALEREVAAVVGARRAIGVSSGTDALLVALMGLEIGPGDEVITSTYSFFATLGSILRCGARPVLVDIEPEGFNIDIDAALERVGPRTRAIVPVHLFGRCCDAARLRRELELPIIEDAAQALGAATPGGRAGSIGHVGCFSFFPSKNLGAAGDGGMLTTNDAAMADRMTAIRTHGQTGRHHHELLGGNFRLDALQAAILRVKLPYLAIWCEARRANAARYRQLLQDAGLAGGAVRLPPPDDGREIYNQFVVRVRDRDRLRQHLASREIGSAVYYPKPMHVQPCAASLGYSDADFPRALRAAQENVALPIYPELTPGQIEEVVTAIADFFAG